jgi:hypothetical protein
MTGTLFGAQLVRWQELSRVGIKLRKWKYVPYVTRSFMPGTMETDTTGITAEMEVKFRLKCEADGIN